MQALQKAMPVPHPQTLAHSVGQDSGRLTHWPRAAPPQYSPPYSQNSSGSHCVPVEPHGVLPPDPALPSLALASVPPWFVVAPLPSD